MKKQLVALFAAAALMTGCSSEDLSTVSGGGENTGSEPAVTETVNTYAVATSRGIGIMATAKDKDKDWKKKYLGQVINEKNDSWQWCDECKSYCLLWNKGQKEWECKCGVGQHKVPGLDKDHECVPKITTAPGEGGEGGSTDKPDTGENPGGNEGEGETPVVPGSSADIEFDIDLSDVLKEAFVMETDDFYIRINGDFIETAGWIDGVSSTSNKASLGLDGQTNLTVGILGLDNITDMQEGYDYTFEAYFWVKNETPLNDGTGSYDQLFDEEMKKLWVNAAYNDKEAGCNINCQADGEDGLSLTKVNDYPEYGYEIRYNVYRGISGRPTTDGEGNYTSVYGDSPYVKVSVHVKKVADDQPTTVTPIYLSWEAE